MIQNYSPILVHFKLTLSRGGKYISSIAVILKSIHIYTEGERDFFCPPFPSDHKVVQDVVVCRNRSDFSLGKNPFWETPTLALSKIKLVLAQIKCWP